MIATVAVLDVIKKAPRRLQSLHTQVVVHKEECPHNPEWTKTTGCDFKAAATADSVDMSLHFWGNYEGQNLEYVVFHELGHLLDRKLGRKVTEKAFRAYHRKTNRTGTITRPPLGRWWFSNTGHAWMKAMSIDSWINPQQHFGVLYVTQYAADHKSAVEDFAESVAYLIQSPTAFERWFPNRAAILKKALGM